MFSRRLTGVKRAEGYGCWTSPRTLNAHVRGGAPVASALAHVAGSSSRNKGSVAFEYFDLGAPSNADEPPASEVVDFFQLLGGTTPTTTGSSG